MRLFEPYLARQSRTLRRVPSVVAAIRSRHAQSVAKNPDEGLGEYYDEANRNPR